MLNQILDQEVSPGIEFEPLPQMQRASGARLSRENQRLRLEKLILERQLKSIMDLIASNEHLESLFLQQVDQQAKGSRMTYLYHR